jgi:hypothetical protein
MKFHKEHSKLTPSQPARWMNCPQTHLKTEHMKKFLYSAYVLTDESKKILETWLAENGKEIKVNKFLTHSTIEYGLDTLLPDSYKGRETYIYVIGYAEDEIASAFIIDLVSQRGEIPHITISTSGYPPVFSNQMLNNPDNRSQTIGPIKLMVTYQKFYTDGSEQTKRTGRLCPHKK